MRTWIHHATIVNEGRKFVGSVVIENEKIAEILENGQTPASPCDKEIDATGCYLLPGVIDDHVHFRDPGLTHKADMATETAAAAAGGERLQGFQLAAGTAPFQPRGHNHAQGPSFGTPALRGDFQA